MSGAEVIQFPERRLEPLEPISELIAAKPSLWEKLLAREGVENPAIVLGED